MGMSNVFYIFGITVSKDDIWLTQGMRVVLYFDTSDVIMKSFTCYIANQGGRYEKLRNYI